MKYVVIGNSAAGIGAVEGIRQVDKQGEIIVITNEPHHTYSRPLISYLLLGKVSNEKMKYRSDSFYTDNNCTLLHGIVTAVEAEAKQVILSDNIKVTYDKLLVATGSCAFVPPFEGLDTVTEKHTFMSLDDALGLSDALSCDKRVLIVGAGLIGLKCAEGILGRVGQITVVDFAPRILSSILDDDGAKLVQKHLENKEIKFFLSNKVKSFEKNTAVLEDGQTIAFDILVLAVGVRPSTALLEGVAEIDKGILISEKSETTACNIYAAGDCAQALDISSGRSKIMALLPNAYMQGECAGINMAGGDKVFANAIPMNAIGFCGLHIITAGNYVGEVYSEEPSSVDEGEDPASSCYKRLFYSDNKLNGYILIGNVEKAGIYTNLIRERTPLDTIDFSLVCKKPGLMAFTKEYRQEKLGGEEK